jgi:hypothetical protein
VETDNHICFKVGPFQVCGDTKFKGHAKVR